MKNCEKLRFGLLGGMVVLLGVGGAMGAAERGEGFLINDISGLNPTYVQEVVAEHEEEGLVQAVQVAKDEGLKVSIAGKKHSMGGHAFYDRALVLDMTGFNKVLGVDEEAKVVTVQSGATWKDVIEYVNDYDLAVQVMQAYNTFTIGGSMSVNVHESDPRFGSMIETVKSFRLLTADGEILNVSREENSELFGLAIGGYGLFGVILDADLYLVENKTYKKHHEVIQYDEYLDYFREAVAKPELEHIFARLSFDPGEGFLRELTVTTYEVTDEEAPHELAVPEKVGLKRFVFGLSRSFDWGKGLRWYLQRDKSDQFEADVITRNNLMNGDLAYLDYESFFNTDILQEYFIPVENYVRFVDGLREVCERESLNLLSATIRYLPPDEEAVLSYAPKESFGVVLYFNVGKADKQQEEVRAWTQELTDLAISLGGTSYLPYVKYATPEQLRAAYPRMEEFFQKKLKYDPNELFINKFYEYYAQ